MEDLPFTLDDLKRKPVEHYLGYHSEKTMSYGFEKAERYTLVTSNLKEADDVSCWSDHKRNGYIWVIEGRKIPKVRHIQYYLREVFQPYKTKEPAVPENYSGAKKDFDWLVVGDGVPFIPLDNGILLNNESWFAKFKEDNGRFGYGLRILRDEAIKQEFLRLAEKHWPQ